MATEAATLEPVPFEEAIKAMEARGVAIPAFYYQVLPELMRNYTFSVAGLSNIAQLTLVLESLTEALKQGQSMTEWITAVKKSRLSIAALPYHRLDNIYRTNLQGMYGRGHDEHFKEFANLRPYLMYDGVNDSRIRPAHKTWDNYVAPINSPIWDSIWYGRNKYRCRCMRVSLSEKQAAQYQAQDAANTAKNKELLAERQQAIVNPEHTVKNGLNAPLTDPLVKAAQKYKGTMFESEIRKLGLL